METDMSAIDYSLFLSLSLSLSLTPLSTYLLPHLSIDLITEIKLGLDVSIFDSVIFDHMRRNYRVIFPQYWSNIPLQLTNITIF